LWEVPFVTEYEQNSITPLAVGDLLIFSGLSKPTVAIRPTQAEGKWTTPEVWRNADVPMYMSTPVESGGRLFGLTHRNRGQFFCLDVRTGKTLWVTKGREGENAALATAPGLVLAMTTEGELAVLRNDPKAADVVKRYTMAESPVWAHPAFVGGGVVIKDADSLAYWRFQAVPAKVGRYREREVSGFSRTSVVTNRFPGHGRLTERLWLHTDSPWQR
jgi:hypothetical protein